MVRLCISSMPEATKRVPMSCRTRTAMRSASLLFGICVTAAVASNCVSNQDDDKQRTASVFTVTVNPIATITFIAADTLSDSAQVYQLAPEPDGRSIAFVFSDPAKGVTRGLGLVQISSSQPAQLGWPDSVLSVWWSGAHQLSFTAGTGRGVRLVVDAHAAELETVEATGAPATATTRTPASPNQSNANALSRAQAFIDSIRVQPEGTPQYSALRYRTDSAMVAPGDTLAAVHVSAGDVEGGKLNPAWYLVHLPSGHVRAVDSLIGRSPGLPASAGQWGADGSFYYAKERSISKVQAATRQGAGT